MHSGLANQWPDLNVKTVSNSSAENSNMNFVDRYNYLFSCISPNKRRYRCVVEVVTLLLRGDEQSGGEEPSVGTRRFNDAK